MERERELERRIDRLERKIDNVDNTFNTIIDLISNLQKENISLKEDREFMVSKYKRLMRGFPVSKDRLAKDVHEKFVNPVKAARSHLKDSIKENADIIKNIIKEGISDREKNPETSPIDELFLMVMDEGNVKISSAAQKFNAHELQIEEWAKILEDHGLIELHYPENGKPELRRPGKD